VVKILSKAGVSLADMYDVVGSIAGVETLESGEVTLVHEMGATIFSERISTFIRLAATDDLLQGVAFETLITNLPSTPFKILGIVVFADVASRVTRASVAVRSRAGGRELPIWVWQLTADQEITTRIDDGTGVSNEVLMRATSLLGSLPHFTVGAGQPQHVGDIALRGQTSAFGAGTVKITLLMHIAFSQIGSGVSSHGLPIPGW